MKNLYLIILIPVLLACSTGPTPLDLNSAQSYDQYANTLRQNADFRQAEYYEKKADQLRTKKSSGEVFGSALFELLFDLVSRSTGNVSRSTGNVSRSTDNEN